MPLERERAPDGPVLPQGQAAAKADRQGQRIPAPRQRTTMDGTPGMSAEYERRRRDVRSSSIVGRWPSPDVAADELLEVFGPYWCQMLVIELARTMGVRR